MKFIKLAAATAALLSVAACSQELNDEVLKIDKSFELIANISSKTAVDANWNVNWVEGDQIIANINGQRVNFTHTSGSSFTTEEFTPTEGNEYDFSLLYHAEAAQIVEASLSENGYFNNVSIPGPGLNAQAAAGDKSHLGGLPLYGHTTTVGTAQPLASMSHLTTVIAINVTNSRAESIKLTKIDFSNLSNLPFAGKFKLNTADGSLSDASETSATTTLNITDGSIAAGETGQFYIPAAPVTIPVGSKIKISITLDGGEIIECEKDITAETVFAAGKFKTTDVNIEAASDQPVEYTFRPCDYYSILGTSLNEGNGTAIWEKIGTPNTVDWTIIATKGPNWKKENDEICGFDAGLNNGLNNNRIKMGTNDTGHNTIFSEFILKTTNLSDKTITHVSIGLSMASKGMVGKVNITVGGKPIVTDEDIQVSTNNVKLTGFIYGADCNEKGDVEIKIDQVGNNGVYYLYPILITYQNE